MDVRILYPKLRLCSNIGFGALLIRLYPETEQHPCKGSLNFISLLALSIMNHDKTDPLSVKFQIFFGNFRFFPLKQLKKLLRYYGWQVMWCKSAHASPKIFAPSENTEKAYFSHWSVRSRAPCFSFWNRL